jgi:hypothetical protein
VSGSRAGCTLLVSGDIELLPVLLALCKENPTSIAADAVEDDSFSINDPDGEPVYAPVRVLVSYALWCLGRLCGEPSCFLAASSADADFVGVWLKALCSSSVLVKQRGLLGVKYMLRHAEGREFVLSSPIFQMVVRIALAPRASYEDFPPAVLCTALEALASLCSPLQAGPALLTTLCPADTCSKLKEALSGLIASQDNFGSLVAVSVHARMCLPSVVCGSLVVLSDDAIVGQSLCILSCLVVESAGATTDEASVRISPPGALSVRPSADMFVFHRMRVELRAVPASGASSR